MYIRALLLAKRRLFILLIYLVAIFLRWLATRPFLVLLQVGFLVPLRARGKFSRRQR